MAGEAGPVCSPGCDEANASGGQAPQAAGRWPPSCMGRSHEGHSSRGPTLNAGTPETLVGEGAWSGVPRRCEWEQGQTLLSPPELAIRPASVRANQPGGTWRASWCSDREHRLGSGRETASARDWGCSRRKSWSRAAGGPAVSSRRFVGAGSAPRLLLLASRAGGLGRTTVWNIHGFSEWEGLTAF